MEKVFSGIHNTEQKKKTPKNAVSTISPMAEYSLSRALARLTRQVTLSFTSGFPGSLLVENPPANVGDSRDSGSIPGSEDPLEEGMATPSHVLACRIPWTEEPGGLQSTGSQRVGHD